ncbi:alkaline phosphatase family protein [Pigmentiphaga litoralis]|nr:alkaline phosphatase family protein [Pigmentiphaga litoralis]
MHVGLLPLRQGLACIFFIQIIIERIIAILFRCNQTDMRNIYYGRMKKASKAILIICDSLRRDLIDPSLAPRLSALLAEGCAFTQARGVFPSTTRTSSASIATGCLPARHGLLGNTVVLQEPDGLRCRSVGDPAFRSHLVAATGGTLRMPTLAERMAGHGGAWIMSNVSPGAAYFFDPDGHGEVHHRAGSYGPGRQPLDDSAALTIRSGAAGDTVMTERFCSHLRDGTAPRLSVLWLSEPDHSGHGHPLGSPAHRRGIANADVCVARVLTEVDALRAQGDDVLLAVGSDHGMETVCEHVPVTRWLVEAGLKQSMDSRDVVLAPNGTAFVLGVAPDAQDRIPALVDWLSAQPWCGGVHHGAALSALGLPVGDPCCAIAVDMAHDDRTNDYGVAGFAYVVDDPDEAKNYLGHGQHGGLGRYEQRPFLVFDGGGFAASRASMHAASLIDIAPTLLRHLGLPHDGMDGCALPLDPTT